MTKMSIVVPVYNVEKYIGHCIESLMDQTLENIEIILVDDGSPDQSGSICDSYQQKDSRIRVLHKKNAGVSAARNDGMDLATGEYILFCDSDDWMAKDACEKLYEKAISTDSDIVIGNVYEAYPDNNKIARFYAQPFTTDDPAFIKKMIQADFYRNYCPMPDASGPAFGYGGPWNKAVRLSMLQENNIRFDVRLRGLFDDILYTAHILAAAKRVSYITDCVYYYRQVAGSITNTYKANTLEINHAIINAWQEFIAQQDTPDEFMKPFYANVIRRLVESLPVYFFSPKNPAPLRDRLKELKNVVSEEIYVTASKNVELSRLTAYHKAAAVLIRQKNAVGIWVLYTTKMYLKKIIRKS